MRTISLMTSKLLVFLALFAVLFIVSAESTFDKEGSDAAFKLAQDVDFHRVMAAMEVNATTENAINVLGMLHGGAASFVRSPNGELRGERNKQAFVTAVDNITANALKRAKKLIGSTNSFVAFKVLLQASSGFVQNPKDSDGSFNSSLFNSRLNALDEKQFTGTIEERIVIFLKLMKPTDTGAVGKTAPASEPKNEPGTKLAESKAQKLLPQSKDELQSTNPVRVSNQEVDVPNPVRVSNQEVDVHVTPGQYTIYTKLCSDQGQDSDRTCRSLLSIQYNKRYSLKVE